MVRSKDKLFGGKIYWGNILCATENLFNKLECFLLQQNPHFLKKKHSTFSIFII